VAEIPTSAGSMVIRTARALGAMAEAGNVIEGHQKLPWSVDGRVPNGGISIQQTLTGA